jgi:hypothetical protein
VQALIERVHRLDGEVDSMAQEAATEFGELDDTTRIDELIEDAPIVKFVNLTISQAVTDRASDIHVEPTEHDMRIRYRVDGVLHEVMHAPKQIQAGVISRLKVMAEINIAERRVPQDGRISVKVNGKRYTRADFEDQTPGILVESPLPFEDVTSPIRATGTANTFEATFNYELTDTDGKIVDENFVTATSGTGTRGTFDFTTKKFTVPFSGVGSLVVFERSAEDGSRTKLVEIPLRMSQ